MEVCFCVSARAIAASLSATAPCDGLRQRLPGFDGHVPPFLQSPSFGHRTCDVVDIFDVLDFDTNYGDAPSIGLISQAGVICSAMDSRPVMTSVSVMPPTTARRVALIAVSRAAP